MSLDLARRAADGDFAPEVTAWLSAGLARTLAGEATERALGLDRASRRRQRDAALLEAARLLDRGQGAWDTAGRLAQALRRFDARILPQLRRLPCLGLSPLDDALRRAVAAGRPPTTQRNLYDLLK